MSEIDVSALGGGFRPSRYSGRRDYSQVELTEEQKLADSSVLDTSALDGDGDPISELAQRLYRESMFNLGRPWDELPGYERRTWYREAARRWLTP